MPPRCPDEVAVQLSPVHTVDKRVVPRLFGVVTLPRAEALLLVGAPCADVFPPRLSKPRCAPVSWRLWRCGPQRGPSQGSPPLLGCPPAPCSWRRRLAVSLCTSVWTHKHVEGAEAGAPGPFHWAQCFEALQPTPSPQARGPGATAAAVGQLHTEPHLCRLMGRSLPGCHSHCRPLQACALY